MALTPGRRANLRSFSARHWAFRGIHRVVPSGGNHRRAVVREGA